LLAVVGVIVGSIGPWVSSPLIDRAGTDGDGVITLLLGCIAGVLLLVRGPGSRWLWMAAALGVICFAVGFYDLVTVSSENTELFGREVDLIDPGWGLWLTTAASLFLVVASYWYYTEVPNQSTSEGAPGDGVPPPG